MNHGTHKVEWIDGRRWPRVAPNPAFPNGIDIPAKEPRKMSCKVELPYPAMRCGQYFIECQTCRMRVIVTTAGRSDDPRSVGLNCKIIPS